MVAASGLEQEEPDCSHDRAAGALAAAETRAKYSSKIFISAEPFSWAAPAILSNRVSGVPEMAPLRSMVNGIC